MLATSGLQNPAQLEQHNPADSGEQAVKLSLLHCRQLTALPAQSI